LRNNPAWVVMGDFNRAATSVPMQAFRDRAHGNLPRSRPRLTRPGAPAATSTTSSAAPTFR
jgi:endonuclease/exonuclease/phosphatase family metal-dependent hydrolase